MRAYACVANLRHSQCGPGAERKAGRHGVCAPSHDPSMSRGLLIVELFPACWCLSSKSNLIINMASEEHEGDPEKLRYSKSLNFDLNQDVPIEAFAWMDEKHAMTQGRAVCLTPCPNYSRQGDMRSPSLRHCTAEKRSIKGTYHTCSHMTWRHTISITASSGTTSRLSPACPKP